MLPALKRFTHGWARTIPAHSHGVRRYGGGPVRRSWTPSCGGLQNRCPGSTATEGSDPSPSVRARLIAAKPRFLTASPSVQCARPARRTSPPSPDVGARGRFCRSQSDRAARRAADQPRPPELHVSACPPPPVRVARPRASRCPRVSVAEATGVNTHLPALSLEAVWLSGRPARPKLPLALGLP